MSPHDSIQPPPPRPNRGHQPSFSAALLDAIYHSLEADADADADARASTDATRRTPASPAQRTPVSIRHRPTPTLSPSVSSVRSPRLQRPPRPCRVRPDPQPNLLLLTPPPPHGSTGDRGEKKRNRKNKKTKTKVAPFACLLNALLCNRKSARSVDNTPRATAAAVAAPEPASARSILSSRASRRASAATGGILTPARRAVRFSPVALVVDDEHGRGIGTATRLRDVEMEVASVKESAAEAEKRVEELLRALGVAGERERAKESSESSSDLFELESLPPAFEDTELPRPRAAAGAGLARPRLRVL
ncbi:protein BIG GRAIN 1-like B [Phragmites australis]|uniref:protein BIG GRAIN 1-like B n=1 Tax=Phragmites australis TaxID=29695 RepID=UPI002D77798E|nr:protein BIG GRAIN 1-like B [Phragmites australis]